MPFRRDVAYVPAQEAAILPLLDQFEFVEDRARWGYQFRFGVFKVVDADMRLIAQAMPALEHKKPVQFEASIRNVNRTVGAMLSG